MCDDCVPLSTSLDWRAAHAWLAGYSDARAGKPNDPGTGWLTYHGDYTRGYDNGLLQAAAA